MAVELTVLVLFSMQEINLHSQFRGFAGGSVLKNPPPVQETWVQSLVWEDPTNRGAARHLCATTISLYSRTQETQLLSPRATTTEAAHPRAHAPQERQPQ